MNQPLNEPDTSTTTTADARRLLLREVGDQAAAWAQSPASDPASSALAAAEDAAYAAGISGKDIDRTRVTGILNAQWRDIRDATDLDDKIRGYLLAAARTDAVLLREMIAVDALADQTRLFSGQVVTADQVREFQQHDRNLPAVHAHVNTVAALLDPTEEEAAAVRSQLDNWAPAISATVNSVGTGAGLEQRWWHHADPWLEARTNQVATSLRHQPAADAEPLLPPLDTARAQARHTAHTHLNPDHARPGATPAAPTTSVAAAIIAALPISEATNPSADLAQHDPGPRPVPAVAAEPGPQL